jgi:hypothetical protein
MTFVEENRANYPGMDVKIPFLTVREMLNYKPKEYAERVACPVLSLLPETIRSTRQNRVLRFSIRLRQPSKRCTWRKPQATTICTKGRTSKAAQAYKSTGSTSICKACFGLGEPIMQSVRHYCAGGFVLGQRRCVVSNWFKLRFRSARTCLSADIRAGKAVLAALIGRRERSCV